MRLLNVKTRCMEEYFNDIPGYATLSHTWAKEEVTFQDWHLGEYQNKAGFQKIDNCCRLAQDSGLEYAWIDTCCIDKTNSSELQEAINSMFMWYQNSDICIVYLADVDAGETMVNPGPSIKRTRWFKRGWTLQELLASRYRYFYDKEWNNIGCLHPGDVDTAQAIARLTGIDYRFLMQDSSIHQASIAARMSWAAHRSTTRQEDVAYCLLGIFDVNMPLLYGEGDKAFIRLQEEILKRSDDETILSWHYGLSIGDCPHGGLLAKSPRCFEKCAGLIQGQPLGVEQRHYSLTNKGLYIKPSTYQFSFSENWVIILNCVDADNSFGSGRSALAVPVVAYGGVQTHFKGKQYWRPEGSLPFFMDWADLTRPSLSHLYLRYEESNDHPYTAYLSVQNFGSLPFRLPYVYPPHSLRANTSKLLESPAKFVDSGRWTEFHLVIQPISEGEAILVKVGFKYDVQRFGDSTQIVAFHGRVSHAALAGAYDVEQFQCHPLKVIRGLVRWQFENFNIGGRDFRVHVELFEHLLVRFPILSFRSM